MINFFFKIFILPGLKKRKYNILNIYQKDTRVLLLLSNSSMDMY